MFDKYQQQSARNFKEHPTLEPDKSQLLDWALGITGEAGEVAEIIKHHVFNFEELDKMELAKELGDVLWYLAAVCTATDINLSAVAELNAAKLAHRYNGEGFSNELSAERHETEKKFEDTVEYATLKAKIYKELAPLNVIFIGPDGSGKTTIAKKVAERLADQGFTYHKCDYRQENKPQLALDLLSSKTNVVYDRFYYPDDIIYTRVTNEHDPDAEPINWDTEYWKMYTEVLAKLCNINTVYIYVDADIETLKERSKSWADEYITTDDLDKIKTLYNRWHSFVSTYPVLVLELDTTTMSVDDAVDKCINSIGHARRVLADINDNQIMEEEEHGTNDD